MRWRGRLRVGIFSPETLAQDTQKANDVVLLQDVIARSSKVRWTKGFDDGTSEEIATFVPTARSKRRPFRKGNTTSALYLTAPRQPLAARIGGLVGNAVLRATRYTSND